MNVAIELMEDGMAMTTELKNTKPPKTSLAFSNVVVIFLTEWAVLSIALVVLALVK